jgi:hypothetical protein
MNRSSPDNELRIVADEASQEEGPGAPAIITTGLTALGGFTAFAEILPQIDKAATTGGEAIGARVIGVIVISVISTLVGNGVHNLQEQLFPTDFPQDLTTPP